MVYSKIIDKQIIITDPYSCICHVIPIKKIIKTSENKKTIFLKKLVYKILGIR